MNLWPHQERGIDAVLNAIRVGHRKICLTSPTGGGKTRMMGGLIADFLAEGKRTLLYTNRRLLLDQSRRVLGSLGFEFGMRAAGYPVDHEKLLQVASIQTEHSRTMKRRKCPKCDGVGKIGSTLTCSMCYGKGKLEPRWEFSEADRVLIDEAHLNAGDIACKILDRHHEEGAAYVGITATPLDIWHAYKHLVIAGTPSELRQCGALVPFRHFGPDEPDLRKLKGQAEERELGAAEIRKVIMTTGLFGRVFQHWKRLNPNRRPTILFAAGVAESVWFAEQFQAQGVVAAHIDGAQIWHDGDFITSIVSTQPGTVGDLLIKPVDVRNEVLYRTQPDHPMRVEIVCNRYVLREGIDCPWLEHGIFATIFDSLQSYLQSGGRIGRASPSTGKQFATLQDHGGNWWRYGSLNEDRHWEVDMGVREWQGMRATKMREKKLKEPIRCPQCSAILAKDVCPCGFKVDQKVQSRPVVQADGTLKEMVGDIFRPRRVTRIPNVATVWKSYYFRALNSKNGMTFRQAEVVFAKENNWGYPPHNLPFMPIHERDWFRKVRDVPRDRLIQ